MDNARQAILLAGLEERYRALSVIRDRVQTMALWILGLLSAGAAWIVVEGSSLSRDQRVFASGAVILVLIVLRFRYFADLQRGFVRQQRVAVRIETELGFYKPGALSESEGEKGIYPIEWQNAGNDDTGGRFFPSNYLLVYVGTILFIAALWI